MLSFVARGPGRPSTTGPHAVPDQYTYKMQVKTPVKQAAVLPACNEPPRKQLEQASSGRMCDARADNYMPEAESLARFTFQGSKLVEQINPSLSKKTLNLGHAELYPCPFQAAAQLSLRQIRMLGAVWAIGLPR